jgi:EmrB/QacA subfamily drug resistance transporter
MDMKRGALMAAILGSAVVAVDATAVNVALPTIADDLGGGLAGQQWTSNAYLLTLASLILVSGSLSDLYGERRVFTIGVAGFGVASMLCAAAPTIELLVAARGLQGVFGALLTPASLAIIVTAFPESERGSAIGSWTAWGGMGYLAGPLLGGQLVDNASWRWVFAINLPLTLFTLALASRYVPERRTDEGARRLDVVGALLCAAGLAGISFGLIEQPLRGWSDPMVAGPLVGGALLFGAFLLWERRTPEPMLRLSLFARRNFAVANVETFLMYGGLALQGFFLVLFLQQVAGFSATEAGAANLVPTGVMFLLSRRFGALADRFGPHWFMTVGPLVVAAGFLLMLRLDADASWFGDLLPALVVFALGLSITVSPLTATVLADADEQDAGIASAVNNAIARTAGLLATAAVGAVLAGFYADRLDAELAGRTLTPAAQAQVAQARDRALGPVDAAALPPQDRAVVTAAVQDAGVSAFHLAALVGAGMLAVAGLLGGLLLRNPRRRTAAERCAGGQFVGAPEEVGGERPAAAHSPA